MSVTRIQVMCICVTMVVIICFCIPIIYPRSLDLRHFLSINAGLYKMADIRVPKGDTTRYRYSVHHVSNSTHDSLDILRKGKDIYMVYDCSNVYPGECGGWSDRLSGMLSVYVISLITNHTFLVRHNKPCPLEDYLDYNAHNWVFDKALVERGHLSYQYISYYCKVPTVVRSHRRERLAVTFNKDINFVRVNWDYTDHFRATKGIGKLVPWITTLQYSDIYRHFFNSLFKIKKEISDYLDIVKGEKKLACAHIRMGESGMTRTTLPELVDIWRVLKQMEKRKFSIFVATDSNLVKRKAKALFSRSSVEIDGVITHIDVTKKGDLCGGFRKAVLDFFMLTRCEELVITRSGFGIMAAYLRRRDKLHCLTPNGVVSCTRLTIHNIYPSPILSPF